MKNILFYISSLLLINTACNLTQTVEIELPDYENQVIVECYLIPNEPFTALITQSASFFAPFPTDAEAFLDQTLLDGVTVRISFDDETVELNNQAFFNPFTGKLANYLSTKRVPARFNEPFTIEIITPNNEVATAETYIPSRVPIDSVVVEFAEQDTLARALTYWTDNPDEANFYRRILAVGTLDSIEVDFTLDDRLVDSTKLVVGTGFDYVEGDTIINIIYHLTEDHYNFVNSVFNADNANGNPFGQPSTIQPNLRTESNSVIGIFTGLSFEESTLIVEK